MSIEENLKSIAESLQQLTEIGKLQLGLLAAQNAEKKSPSTPPSSASEPAQTESSPSPSPTAATTPAKKPGRPRKVPENAAPAVPLDKLPDVIPEPQPSVPPPTEPVVATPAAPAEKPAPAVVVEARPAAVADDDFFSDAPTAPVPDPTPENVRKALIEYAERHGGSQPNQGGRKAARDLMLKVTGCQLMPQLEEKVKATNNVGLYADIIKAAMEG